MKTVEHENHRAFIEGDERQWSEEHRMVSAKATQLRDEIIKADAEHRIGVLYRARGDDRFHWTGVGDFPEDFVMMLQTLADTAAMIGQSQGYDPQELREIMATVVRGQCMECGEPIDGPSRHVH